MSEGDERMIDELRQACAGQAPRTAQGDGPHGESEGPALDQEDLLGQENPLESDFFKAMNAFRTARTSGDRDAIAAAERRLQDVVRRELTGD